MRENKHYKIRVIVESNHDKLIAEIPNMFTYGPTTNELNDDMDCLKFTIPELIDIYEAQKEIAKANKKAERAESRLVSCSNGK